jgi:hypothetical protein
MACDGAHRDRHDLPLRVLRPTGGGVLRRPGTKHVCAYHMRNAPSGYPLDVEIIGILIQPPRYSPIPEE